MAQLSHDPQPAPASAPSPVGAFSPLVLTRVLQHASRPEHQGALHVVSGPSVKTISFGRGSVRFASSNIRRDRLGESMLAHDFISRSDFRVASDTMRREGIRFGQALVSMGRLTETELNRELAIQAQRIVLSLFRIDEGTYRLEAGLRPNESLPYRLPVTPLLLKGLRSIKDGRLILSELPPAETLLRVSPSTPPGFKMDKLTRAERKVLDYASGGRAIRDIIRQTGCGRVEAFHGCFTLLALGLLEPVPVPESTTDTQAAPETLSESRTAIECEAEPEREPEREREGEGEGEAEEKPQSVLEPGPAAAGFEALAEPSTPFELSPSPGELEEALASIAPSSESSSQPRAERRSNRSKGRKTLPPEELVRLQFERLDSVTEASLLGVREDVGLDELERAYGDLKAEWTELRAQTDDQSLHLKLDAIERRLAAAYANLRFQRQSAESDGSETAPNEPDETTEPFELETGETNRLTDPRVEQLERDLEMHFQVRDWAGAMSLLHELVAMHPENARYHAQLATAMQYHSSSRINAEQHFLEAVRLSPDDPALRLDLARYYHLLNQPARARTELERALELDPDNEEAAKLMGSGRSSYTMKKLLRRMFGSGA